MGTIKRGWGMIQEPFRRVAAEKRLSVTGSLQLVAKSMAGKYSSDIRKHL